MSTESKSREKKTESDIPKWAVFSLCLITVLVVVSIIKTVLPLLFLGLLLAFIWSQATKPVADIGNEPMPNEKQLNLFHKQYRIGRKYSRAKLNIKEKDDRRAA